MHLVQCLSCPSIDSPFSEGEGNVYNGGTPPWLMDDKGNIKTSAVDALRRRAKKNDRRHPQKLGLLLLSYCKRCLTGSLTGADLDRAALSHSKNYLPNFGGVWQMDLSRSESMSKYRQEQQANDAEE